MSACVDDASSLERSTRVAVNDLPVAVVAVNDLPASAHPSAETFATAAGNREACRV